MHQSWLKNQMCVLGWISRSHARDGSEIQTFGRCASGGKIEKLSFLIPVIPNTPENHETWHGVMTWHQHAAVIFWPNWDKLWCKLLANQSFPQEGSWFREGTCHLRVRNEIRTLPSPALIFLHRQIRPNRSIVLNFRIIPGSFGLFYTLIEYLRI